MFLKNNPHVLSHLFINISKLNLFFLLFFSTRARAHPSPIETGYQSYLLNLMHALSTHSHPVTSPLNIETGFSGITRTSISQRVTPHPPPLPKPQTKTSMRPRTHRHHQSTGAHVHACTFHVLFWVSIELNCKWQRLVSYFTNWWTLINI